ncbi:GGDEF domain-containing protein [Methylophaga thalassica]|uniref:GGDEF domain-containing protein n=1 Tax=Methylophaga thalassica TaxID=40223 RepID=UPI002E7BBAE5|nr:GGDEF domain-containing protein [Methylophaga thalassica]WVI84249.1 GGDEF domain-containing protein [Methylophaga thalassica]
MLRWVNSSISRKIGGLSIILLSFLIIMIIYSMIGLQQIRSEMIELAEVDTPLTEVVSEIELLQLRQHILIELFRQTNHKPSNNNINPADIHQQLESYNQHLSEQMYKASAIIESGIEKGRIRFKQEQHQLLLTSMNKLHQVRLAFEKSFMASIQAMLTGESINWEHLEQQDQQLDDELGKLLNHLNALTVSTAIYTEKHESNFMIMTSILGVCAFVIGLYLTQYTIQYFRQRITQTRDTIHLFRNAIEHREVVDFEVDNNIADEQDELSQFEHELKLLLKQFSHEIISRDEIEKQLIELATLDKLTGAYNRHKWDEQLKMQLNLASRGAKLSLLLIDADHFKKVNDQYGHEVGDAVLIKLVELLKNRLRETDTIFRIGGEEFAVLVKQTEHEQALEIAKLLQTKIDTYRDASLPHFTVSIGITSYQAGDTTTDFFNRADNALYLAKANGRNRVEVI